MPPIFALIQMIATFGVPLAEKLLPPILALINGATHPDLDKPLRELLSEVDFDALLSASRKKREEEEAKVPVLSTPEPT